MTSAVLIANKHLDEITLDDLKSLVEIEAAESDRLELKRDLPIANDAKGWRHVGKLHKSETRAIAKEIVALANSYGGRLYIGINETPDDPKRAAGLAEPLPNVAALTERLGDGLNGLISPPIRGLALKAIVLDDRSDGYIVIDVPRSLDSPHGLGIPPECYWRRASSSQPMEMRDLQNLFWETRTRTERILSEQRASMRRYDLLEGFFDTIKYRFTLVSAEALSMGHLTQRFQSGDVVPPSSTGAADGIAANPLWRNDDWTFAAFGTVKAGKSPSQLQKAYNWAVDEIGVIEVIGSASVHPNSGFPGLLVDPWEFCATAAHLLHLGTHVHRFSKNSLDHWIFDGQISANSDVVHARSPRSEAMPVVVDLSKDGAMFRPMSLSLETDTEAVFEEIQRRIWAAFGQAVNDRAKLTYVRPPLPVRS